MDKNSDVIMGIVVTALFLAIFVGLIYAVLKLLGGLLSLNRRKDPEWKASQGPSKTRTRFLVLAVAMMGLLLCLAAPRIKNAPTERRPDFSIWTFLPPFFLLFMFFYWMWTLDLISSLAKLRFYCGDRDGAIRMLREAIEDGKTTAERSNTLGILYLQRTEPERALKMFRDAVKLGGDASVYLANQAAALHDLGRFEDAAIILDDLCQKDPQQWVFACSYGRVLVSLGRFDEAHAQIERAERLPIIGGNRSVLAERARLIQECRDLMAGKSTSMKPTGLDEI
jgi:tetratricopeptide (TPR) repeat protein